MTMIEVDVDLEHYLDEIAEEALVEELEYRGKKIVGASTINLAQSLRSAFYRRDASRFEALLIAHLDPQEIKKPAEASPLSASIERTMP